jgi:hypothetical protein
VLRKGYPQRGRSALGAKAVRVLRREHNLLENSTWPTSLLLSNCNNWSGDYGRIDERAAYHCDISEGCAVMRMIRKEPAAR